MDYINNELPVSSVISGDLTARCSKWYKKDITSFTGREIDTPTSSAGYKQIINKPTHIANNTSSYTDLIFCSNLNLLLNHGVDLHYLKNVIIILFQFQAKSTFEFPVLGAMFVKYGIIVAPMLKIYKSLLGILIGKGFWKPFFCESGSSR